MDCLDPHLLPAFVAVADAGKVSTATELLGVSQPAVTAQIRRLEEALGARLFQRSSRGMHLTPAGRRLLGYARQIQRLLDEASNKGAGADGELSGELLLAASATVAAHVLPGLLRSFLQVHPRLRLRLEVGSSDQVAHRVAAGAIPLGLIEGPARAPGLKLEPYLDDELVPVTGGRSVYKLSTRADLARAPLLWREAGSPTRNLIERTLRLMNLRRGPAPGDVELGSTEAIKGAAIAGLGVGILSRWAVQRELASGDLLEVELNEPLRLERQFRWAFPAAGIAPLPQAFLGFAREAPPALP